MVRVALSLRTLSRSAFGIFAKASLVGAKTVMSRALFGVSTRPAFRTAVTRVERSQLFDAAVATGSFAMPSKLPAPVAGTDAHAVRTAGRPCPRVVRRALGLLGSGRRGRRVLVVLAVVAGTGGQGQRQYDGAGDGEGGTVTSTTTECQPVAPSGTVPTRFSVCVWPSRSVARTSRVWLPVVARHSHTHWHQVSWAASRAVCQSPPAGAAARPLRPPWRRPPGRPGCRAGAPVRRWSRRSGWRSPSATAGAVDERAAHRVDGTGLGPYGRRDQFRHPAGAEAPVISPLSAPSAARTGRAVGPG